MRDELDVGGAVAACGEQRGQLREVGDRRDVGRALLAAEAAVEIRADAAVPGVAGNLADVVDVVDHAFERDAGALGR